MSGDASCSGPNPFKRFTDHASRDNSLRQDRLVGNSQGQGSFRSQTQNIGQSQDQFEAFQNQGPQMPSQHLAHLEPEPALQNLHLHSQNLQNQMVQNHASQASQAPHAAHFLNPQVRIADRPNSTPAAGGANWAAEFAAMNARGQTPVQQAGQRAISQPFSMQHQSSVMNRPFMPNFMPAPAQASTFSQGSSNGTFAPLYDPSSRGVDAEIGAKIRNDANDDFADEMDAWMRANGTNGFTAQDMAGIDAELEAVAREFAKEDTNTTAPVEDPEAIMTQMADQQDATRAAEEVTARLAEQLNLADAQPDLAATDLRPDELASLSQPQSDTVAPSATDQPSVNSEIADAAGRLIDSVQHETGHKWANSSFLKLMREFRDGDKVVEDGTVKDAVKRDPAGDVEAPQGGASGTAV